jgi:rod shape determining protein RodA
LQPAEFAKFATALALAKYMSAHNFKLSNVKDAFVVGLLIFIPFAIIIMQNETGSALVYVAFVLMLFREGLPGIFLFLGFWAVYLFIVVVRFLDIPIAEGLPGEFGNFIAYISVIVVQFFLLLLNKKRTNAMKILFIGNIILFGIAFLLQITNLMIINYETVALISIGLSIILHLICSYIEKERNFLVLVFFLVFSVGYCSSIEYVFEKVLQPHQQMRIKVTLGIEDDPTGAGYNVNQSLISIGSGGLTGKGFLNGTQTKLNYVPEQDTDFIFCTVGEEHGFLGSALVLLLFLTLILRLIIMAERQRTVFARIYGYCVACILLFHVTINIGMVLGLTPVIGIPLPFFSYGGSSLWGFTIMLFVFLRMDMSRKEKLG